MDLIAAKLKGRSPDNRDKAPAGMAHDAAASCLGENETPSLQLHNHCALRRSRLHQVLTRIATAGLELDIVRALP